MMRYILGRLLWSIPTLFIISLLAFIISVNAPGDPAEILVSGSEQNWSHKSSTDDAKSFWIKKLGLDLPVFYVTLKPLSAPSFAQISGMSTEEKIFLNNLSFECGNAEAALALFSQIKKVELLANRGLLTDNENLRFKVMTSVAQLQGAKNTKTVKRFINQLNDYPISDTYFKNQLKITEARLENLNADSWHWKSYVPKLEFHTDNRYHRWLFGDPEGFSKGILRGDFGISYTTRQPVSQIIWSRLGWSALLAFLAVLLAYLISIPVGVWAGANPGSWFDRITGVKLFVLFSIPSFWMGTLLLMTFANPAVLDWFPASGVGPAVDISHESSLFLKIVHTLPYLVLPVICFSYSSAAFITRSVRASIKEHMMQDHIRTARAKGLPLSKIIFTHALKNSLIPLIALFTTVFPAAVSGSIVVENIFTIPGMGYETVHAVFSRNYPVIIAVFTIAGAMAVAGNLLGDLLYAFADPRIRFSNRRK